MNRKTSSLMCSILILLLITLVLTACDEKPTKAKPENTGIVTGYVSSVGRSPLAGVTVSIGTKSSITNAQGQFFLYGVKEGSQIKVNFAKEDFIPNQKLISVIKDKTSYVESSLKQALTVNFASTAQAVLTDGQTQIIIPENAFVAGSTPFTGNVMAEYKYFDPSEIDNINSFPGGFSGVQTDGTETLFESFGYLYASFSSVSQPDIKLQLASGKKAEIKSWIPDSMLDSAPVTIPMLHYDEVLGKWFEEGTGTKVGHFYEAEVGHFSYWNFDAPITIEDQATIIGRVLMLPDNTPVAHARVVATGIDYSGYTTVSTGEDGTFSITVKASSKVQIDVYCGVYSMPPFEHDTAASGDSSNIGDLVLQSYMMPLMGRLLTESGEPFMGEVVVLRLINPPPGVHFQEWIDVDEQGNFAINAYYDGSDPTITMRFATAVWQENVKYYSNPITMNVPQPGHFYNMGDIVMRIGGKIKASAKDHEGHWVANSRLTFYAPSNEIDAEMYHSETDGQGFFILYGPPNTTVSRRGTASIDGFPLYSEWINLSFPASGAQTNIGTIVFSPNPD